VPEHSGDAITDADSFDDCDSLPVSDSDSVSYELADEDAFSNEFANADTVSYKFADKDTEPSADCYPDALPRVHTFKHGDSSREPFSVSITQPNAVPITNGEPGCNFEHKLNPFTHANWHSQSERHADSE
jgi:hypothetical protein